MTDVPDGLKLGEMNRTLDAVAEPLWFPILELPVWLSAGAKKHRLIVRRAPMRPRS